MNFKTIIAPRNLLPLLLLMTFPLLILFAGRQEGSVTAGTWLFERKMGQFFPVWYTPAPYAGTVSDRESGFRRFHLEKTGTALWAQERSLRFVASFPASLFAEVRDKNLTAGTSPFLRSDGGRPSLLPWLYPTFFLFVGLFLIRKSWAKAAAAVLIGTFLFLYTLQISSIGTGAGRTTNSLQGHR